MSLTCSWEVAVISLNLGRLKKLTCIYISSNHFIGKTIILERVMRDGIKSVSLANGNRASWVQFNKLIEENDDI
jgi:hypothetical protein